MNIVILETGLFPDQDFLRDALADSSSSHSVHRSDLREARSEAQWDRLLDEILSSDRVITI